MASEPRSGVRFVDARVGSRVAIRRIERGLSLSDVAMALGITEADAVAREQGKFRYQAEELVKLAKLLEIKPGWFFESLDVTVTDKPFDD